MNVFKTSVLHVSDDDVKMTSADSADDSGVSSRTLGHDSNLSTPVGPDEFLELYRTRTVSDPRSDQRLDALSRVRMKKVGFACISIAKLP